MLVTQPQQNPTTAVLVPAQLAFFELRISREKGMRLLLTRRLAGERIAGKWFVHRDSIDAFIRNRS